MNSLTTSILQAINYKFFSLVFFFGLLSINPSGWRTYVFPDDIYRWEKTRKIVLDKVFSDQRSAAFAATIIDIKEAPYGAQWWSNCKGCEYWYKSEQTILSEARYRFSPRFWHGIIKNLVYNISKGTLHWLAEHQEVPFQ